jgi:hypothetical protein
VRYRAGTIKSVDPPGALTIKPEPAGTYYTTPMGINSGGAVSGYYSDNGLQTHGFVRSRHGTYSIIDAPGSAGFTKVLGINPAGTIFGFYYDDSGSEHTFVRSRDGIYTALDAAYPTGINAAGELTGSYNGHGFLLIPNGFQKESPLGAQ